MHNQFIRHIYKFSWEQITTLSGPTLDNPLTQYGWMPVKKSPIYYLQTLLWKLMRRHTYLWVLGFPHPLEMKLS